jgi:HSP20 family protein
VDEVVDDAVDARARPLEHRGGGSSAPRAPVNRSAGTRTAYAASRLLDGRAGLTVADIEIELEGETLSVRGAACPTARVTGAAHRARRRALRADAARPPGPDADKISASLTDGALSLSVPGPESLKPRHEEIQGSAGA